MKIRSIMYTVIIFCIMYVLMSFAAMSFEVTQWSDQIRLFYVIFSVILSALVLFIAWDKVHFYIHKEKMEEILIEFHTQALEKKYDDFTDFVDKFIKDLK